MAKKTDVDGWLRLKSAPRKDLMVFGSILAWQITAKIRQSMVGGRWVVAGSLVRAEVGLLVRNQSGGGWPPL